MNSLNKFQVLGLMMLIAAIVFFILDYDTVAMVLAGLAVTTLAITRMQAGKLPKK